VRGELAADRLFTPSAATITSASPSPSLVQVASVGDVLPKRSSTPSSAARSCRICSSRRRAMPLKPWPLDVIVRPRKWMSMSSQCAKLSVIARYARRVGRAQVLERLVGEDDAPAERVVRRYGRRWIRALQQNGQVQTRRSATYDRYVQG
jgi:hypothetical protein